MKYRVINQSVEVAGKVRHPGDVLDESLFLPLDPNARVDEGDPPAVSEADSLLQTGHIEAVAEET